MKMIISFRAIWENMMNIKASVACIFANRVAVPHTTTYGRHKL